MQEFYYKNISKRGESKRIMYLLDWLLIETPNGATYLQMIITLLIVFLLAKYFVLPDLKEIQDLYRKLSSDEDKTI